MRCALRFWVTGLNTLSNAQSCLLVCSLRGDFFVKSAFNFSTKGFVVWCSNSLAIKCELLHNILLSVFILSWLGWWTPLALSSFLLANITFQNTWIYYWMVQLRKHMHHRRNMVWRVLALILLWRVVKFLPLNSPVHHSFYFWSALSLISLGLLILTSMSKFLAHIDI